MLRFVSSGATKIIDELMGGCLDGYVEKHNFKNGTRYIIKPSNMFIELHVISEGDNVCVEIWDNGLSASPIFTQSFTNRTPGDVLSYIICRVYRLLMIRRLMSSKTSQEVPLKAVRVRGT